MLEERSAATIAGRYALGNEATLSGPVARGEQGQVWRLTTSRGAWAVKELAVRQTETDASADADFQDAVHAAGVPMPRVVRTTGGDVLTELGSVLVRVYEWVDLDEPDIGIEPSEVGRVVASIQRVRQSGKGRVDRWHTEPVGGDRWDELVRALEASGAPYARDLARYREELVALEDLMEPPSDLQICHCDLWADNVRTTPTGGVCVIDWENCGPADPSQELGMVLFEFANGNPHRARVLYEAYVAADGPARIDHPGNFSMAIGQIGHIAEKDYEKWLDPAASDVERERCAGRIAEFTSRPLTRAVINELLDAVSR